MPRSAHKKDVTPKKVPEKDTLNHTEAKKEALPSHTVHKGTHEGGAANVESPQELAVDHMTKHTMDYEEEQAIRHSGSWPGLCTRMGPLFEAI